MFSFRKSDSFLLILILLLFTCLAVLSKRAPPSQANSLPQMVDDHIFSELKEITDFYRHCLLSQLFHSEQIWKRIPSAIETCMVGKFWRSLDVHKVKIPSLDGQYYHFIPPNPISSPCVSVRMNVRLSDGLIPEKTLRQMMPQCEFFGAGEEAINFRSFGKFYRKATSFMEPPDHMIDIGNGHRISIAKAPYYPIMIKEKTFLEKYVNRSRIDYLWIYQGVTPIVTTADGTQAALAHAFFHQFSVIRDPIDVTICQITVPALIVAVRDKRDLTMHARPLFKPLFLSLLSTSSFLPIRGEYISVPYRLYEYLNVFYVNMSNPYCVKKYLSICNGDECQDDEF